jgi:sarcosine oxidase subunit gamma
VGAIHVDGFRILTLAPGEWLLVSDAQSPSAIHQQLAAGLATQGAVLVDVTDGLGALKVRGPLARDVLSKGCGLDFHSSAFPVGRCARTRFAQMSAIIEHVDAAPSFHIYVARSHLRYLADWLADAAVEFTNESV